MHELCGTTERDILANLSINKGFNFEKKSKLKRSETIKFLNSENFVLYTHIHTHTHTHTQWRNEGGG